MNRVMTGLTAAMLVGVMGGAAWAQDSEEQAEPKQYVTGIGGIFFKTKDPNATRAWYREHLNMVPEPFGGIPFTFREDDDPETRGYAVWGPFKGDTKYFAPSEQPFMINLRVRDLDGLLEKLAAEGIEQVSEMEVSDFGKFAWIIDPDGVKIELWEQTHPIPE